MKNILLVLGGIVAFGLLIAFGLSMRYGGQEARRFFEPRDRAIDRQVYEQTPSFVHGKTQFLGKLRRQYEAADTPASRASLREMILTEAAVVDASLLPQNLQSFLITL